MTDTATGTPAEGFQDAIQDENQAEAPTSADSNGKESRPRDVKYGWQEVENMPVSVVGRKSELEEILASVVEDASKHGKAGCIASYGTNTAASAAAQVLRERHGNRADIEGWEFAVRKAGDRTGLYAVYDPSRIVDGARAKFLSDQKTHKAELAVKREKAAADKAKAEAKAQAQAQTGTKPTSK